MQANGKPNGAQAQRQGQRRVVLRRHDHQRAHRARGRSDPRVDCSRRAHARRGAQARAVRRPGPVATKAGITGKWSVKSRRGTRREPWLGSGLYR
jgi:hypothetical protein